MPTDRTRTVAIVDDDASVCRAMLRLLHAAGFQATSFPSAEDFLAEPNHTHFDCLLLDIQLSGMSGLELQTQLTAEKNPPPIIFISAHSEPEYRRPAEQAGCFAYLSKTVPGSAVIATIHQAADLRQAS